MGSTVLQFILSIAILYTSIFSVPVHALSFDEIFSFSKDGTQAQVVSALKKNATSLWCALDPIFSYVGIQLCDNISKTVQTEVIASTSTVSTSIKTTSAEPKKNIEKAVVKTVAPNITKSAPVIVKNNIAPFIGVTKEYLEQRFDEFRRTVGGIGYLDSAPRAVLYQNTGVSGVTDQTVQALSARIRVLELAGVGTTSVSGGSSFSSSVLGLEYATSTGILSLTSGYTIPTIASTTEWATAFLNRITSASSPLSLVGNSLSISKASSTASGYLSSTDWSTFSSKQDAINSGTSFTANAITATTFYGDGSNLTGITSFSTSTTRSVLSSTATGLTYNNSTGVFSLTSGFEIPTTASTTEWNSFFTTPSSRITAGTGLSWSGNTLNSTGVTSIGGLTGAVSTSSLGLLTTHVAEGSNLYFTNTRADQRFSTLFAGTTTDALAEGSTNQYFTNARVRTALSSTATGLTYNNSTGVFSLTSGFEIPTTASTTEWNSFFTTPSSRITAGTGLSWSGNTLNAVGGSSQWTTTGSDIYYSTGNVGVGTTTPSQKLTVAGNGLFTGSVNISGIGSATSTINTDILLSGDIIPSADNTYRLGSPSRMWKDVYIGPGSLYVNGQKVLQTDVSNNVTVSADLNQNLVMKTTGTGDIEFNPSGVGQVLIKGNLRLTAGKTIVTSDLSPVPFTDGVDGGHIRIEDNRIGVTNLNGGISIEPNGIGGTYFTSGNVGIATTTPSEKLSVVGNGLFSGTVTASTFYGDGSNLTGITSFSTSTTRSVLSSTATGLTYNNSTGVFSLTSGFEIPTTASTTEWNSFFTTPSSRITAGTGLSWSGNTLGLSGPMSIANGGTGTTTTPTFGQLLMGNASGGYDLVSTSSLGISGGGVASQWTTTGSDIYYSTGNVGVGTTTPFARLGVAGAVGSNADIFSVTSATNNRHFAVASSGRVYIGSGTPSINSRLTIFSDRSDDALVFRDTASSSNARIYLSQPQGSAGTASLNIDSDRIFLRGILNVSSLNPIGAGSNLILGNSAAALTLGNASSITLVTNVANTEVFKGGVNLNTVIKPYSTSHYLLLAPDGGNVGIGTSSPTTKFMINGVGSTVNPSSNGTVQAFIGTNGNTNIGLVIRAFSVSQSAPLQEWQASNGTPVATITRTGIFTLGSTGQVADGSTGGYATVNGYTAMLGNGGTGFGVGVNSTSFNVGTSTLANPLFTVVKATQNTGVGIVTPLYTLDVSRSTTTTYVARIINSANSSSAHGLLIQGGDNTTGGSTLLGFQRTDGTVIGSVTQDGASGILFNTTSDRRLKENITNTRYSLDDLMKIEIKDYNFVSDPSKKLSTGLIAQDLFNIYPEAVSKPIDELTGQWGVDYGRIAPLLIKGVQDLASTTFAIRDMDSSRVAGQTFISRLISWLADATNGIGTLFVGKVQTKELCIDDVCVTKDQLIQVLQMTHTAPAPNPDPTPTPPPTDPVTEEPSSEPASDPVPESIPTPPEPAQE